MEANALGAKLGGLWYQDLLPSSPVFFSVNRTDSMKYCALAATVSMNLSITLFSHFLKWNGSDKHHCKEAGGAYLLGTIFSGAKQLQCSQAASFHLLFFFSKVEMVMESKSAIPRICCLFQ